MGLRMGTCRVPYFGLRWQSDSGDTALAEGSIRAPCHKIAPKSSQSGVGAIALPPQHKISRFGDFNMPWSARELQPLLGYSQWRRLEDAIKRAVTSCIPAGNDPSYHFAGYGFHDAGYKGLYGGLGVEAIKKRKRIPEKEQLMDRMDTTELAANQFRMTQTRDKLKREGIRGAQRAIDTHLRVGKEVRAAIERIGGTPPELLPPAEPVQEVKKRLKRDETCEEDLKSFVDRWLI